MAIRLVDENEELQGDIYKPVVRHAFVWISDGYFYTIFRPIVESLQKRQADFTDLYNRLLRDRRNSMLRRYSPEKKKEVQEFLQKLRPPYFSSLLKEAQNSLYNEHRSDSTENYFERSENVLMPLASGIHANIHTFGWTGSVIGLFQHHKMCMEQLLNHKFTEVREWAANCIQEFDEEIKRETLHEDYVRLHYQ